MKSWYKFSLAMILMFASGAVSAQIRSTYTGGLHISTMKAEGLNSKPTRPLGIHFGFLFDIPVLKTFSFQPGIIFSAKGADYELDSIHHSISPIYLEVPANAAFTFGRNKVRISLFAGPYIAFGVGGSIWESGQPAKDIRFGNSQGKDIRFVDMGLNFGTGICINRFILTIQYEKGLSNTSGAESGYPEMKNRVLGISFSTSFATRK